LKDVWETIVKNYEFVKDAQMSNRFIILLALIESKQPLSTTQISEKIAINSKGQLFKVSGALKDSLENRLRKAGYVDGRDIPNEKRDRKPIRMTLYAITPKGQKLLKGWLAFLLALT
jgi:DNA-binding PadR family transcriptional regulator